MTSSFLQHTDTHTKTDTYWLTGRYTGRAASRTIVTVVASDEREMITVNLPRANKCIDPLG